MSINLPEPAKVRIERRSKIMVMTDAQFREYVVTQFEEGHKDRQSLCMLLEENTRITQSNCDKTQTIVSIMNFSETSAKRVVRTGKWLSAAAKILIPIVVLYGTIAGIAHGKFPSLKDLL